MKRFMTLICLCFSLNAIAAERPNIVLIMADDMGYECLSCNGSLDYKTPQLDALAQKGLRFEHCYSLPICTPSRVKLMTGQYSFRNYERFGLLPASEVTFGTQLQAAGYRTAMVGKWQLGGDWRTPTQFGFDEYCLQNGINPKAPYDRKTRGRSRYWGYPPIVANGELYKSEHTYGPDMLNEYAVNFITRKKDQPFFLYYPMLLTHSPFEPSPLTPGQQGKDGKTSEVQYFKDMVEYTDRLVGNVVQALEQSGQRENTLILFTGDNGTTYPVKVTATNPDVRRMATDGGRVGTLHVPGQVSPSGKKGQYIEGPITRTTYGDVPGGKDLMNEFGTHVPLIVNWPRHAKAYAAVGHECKDLVDFTDFFATFVELAGAESPVERTLDGISFVDRLTGQGPSPRDHVFCHYWHFGRDAKRAKDAIHDGHWKLYSDGRFFDMPQDMAEAHPLDVNVLSQNADEAHQRLLHKYKDVRGLAIPNEAPSKMSLGANTSKAPTRIEKPNVVLIYSDDQGWGDVGYHGFEDIMTPNIDTLAAHGTQFSQGYVCASVCGPSRAGLLTGIYQQRMGVYGNYDKGGIPTRQPMIFEMLKKQGYQTGAIGKWHVGAAQEELRPNNRGVDFFYGFLWGAHDYSKSSTDPEDPRKSERPIYRNTKIEPPIQDSNGYLTEMFTKEAVGFIERTSDEPFFLYVAYNAVHHPWDVPKPYVDRVQGLKTHDERKLFAGMVLAMDDGVGAVMDALKKKGVADDTLVIFMSDNGSPRGQGIAQPRQKVRGTTTMSSPGPFNGFKGDTYEGGIRIPFVMHWPGRIPAGKTYSHPVINLDLMPTILARCGVSSPGKGFGFDGVDLMPYITGRQQSRPHNVLYWRRGEDYAIRQGDWKLTWNDQAGPQTIRLFDMANDPEECKDLSARHPDRAQTLKNLFDAWDSQLPDNQSGRNPRNRNVGYVTGDRINVAKYNASQGGAEPVIFKTEKSGAKAAGRTLTEQLAIARVNAKKSGNRFDAARTTRWFRVKDLNNDGVLDEIEQKTKAPVGWNTIRE